MIFFFARVTRAAIVASGTRKAAAISARGEPAEQPQRQRHLGLAGQRRVAAGEDQPQPLVGDHLVVPLRERRVRTVLHPGLDQQRQLAPQGLLAAQHVEGAPAGRGREPRAGRARHALPAPGVQRRAVRVLDALLGEVDAARDAHRRGEHEAPLATVRVGDRGLDVRRSVGLRDHPSGKVMIGRTSTPPNGAGQSLAIASAWSRSFASIR